VLKRLFSYFKKYRKDLYIGMVCVVFESVFELVIPLIMADIIDVGVVRRDTAYIYRKSLVMGVCALISLGLGACYARFSARAGEGFGTELREAEYRRVQGYSFSNLDHFSTPSLITRLTSDITILQNAICNGLRPIVRGPTMLLMGLAMSILMSPKLAVVFLTAIPILGCSLYLILKKLGPLYASMQKALDHVNAIIQENLIAIRTVKSYVRGDGECRKFGAVNERFRRASERSFHYAVLILPCFQAVMYATIVCILWFGGNMIAVGSLQVGKLTGFLSYVLQILNSLMMIANVFLMLSRSMTSTERIFEVLDEKPAIADGPGRAPVERGSVDFDHVYFKYRPDAREYVLSDICLHIEEGSTVGIIGGTGSAKSSLVQLIPRLYDVSSGTLRVSGRDVREYSLARLRDAVGVVLQKNILFSGTIRENLLWGNEKATREDLDWACRIACADEFLSRFPQGYDTDLGQGGVNVSGGQKQRLCIARALLKRPKILILDDSTSAVDAATEARIRDSLKRELGGMTKIMVTQRLNSIRDADQIVVLENGRINETGTHGQLLAHNPIYRDIYELQEKGAAV
jgi:ATP-binding cassette subfamily B protein